MAEDIANFDIQSTLQVGVEGTERVGSNVQTNIETPLNKTVTAANNVEKAVKRIGASSAQLDVSARINRSQQAFARTLQTARTLNTSLHQVTNTIQLQATALNQASLSSNRYIAGMQKIARLVTPIGGSMITGARKDASQEFMANVQRSMAMRLVGLWAVMRNVNTVMDTTSTMDMLNASMIRTTGSTIQTADAMKYAMQIGMQYGAVVTDVASTMVELSRTGMDTDSVKYLTANIAEIRYLLATSTGELMKMQDVTDHAVGIMNQLNLSTVETVRVMRLMAELDVQTATSFDKLGNALTRFAASGRVAGLSLEEMLKISTILTERGFTGETAGTSANTIVMRVDRGPDERNFMRDQGVMTIERLADGSIKANSALERLVTTYAKLKQQGNYIQLMDMANLYAGTRQASRFFALMDGMLVRSQELDRILKEGSADSGAAFEARQNAVQAMNDTIAARRAYLQNVMSERFVQPFFTEFVKGFLSEAVATTDMITSMIDTMLRGVVGVFSFGGLFQVNGSPVEGALSNINTLFQLYLSYKIPQTIYMGTNALTSSLADFIEKIGKGYDTRRGIALFDDLEKGITGQTTYLKQATQEVLSAQSTFTSAMNKMYTEYESAKKQFTYEAFDPAFSDAFRTMQHSAPQASTFKPLTKEISALSVQEVTADLQRRLTDISRVSADVLSQSFGSVDLSRLDAALRENVIYSMQSAFSSKEIFAGMEMEGFNAKFDTMNQGIRAQVNEFASYIDEINRTGGQIDFSYVNERFINPLRDMTNEAGAYASAMAESVAVGTQVLFDDLEVRFDSAKARVTDLLANPNMDAGLRKSLMEVDEWLTQASNNAVVTRKQFEEMSRSGTAGLKTQIDAQRGLVDQIERTDVALNTAETSMNNVGRSAQNTFGRIATTLANGVTTLMAWVSYAMMIKGIWDTIARRITDSVQQYNKLDEFRAEYERRQQSQQDYENAAKNMQDMISARGTSALNAVNTLINFANNQARNPEVPEDIRTTMTQIGSEGLTRADSNFFSLLSDVLKRAAALRTVDDPRIQSRIDQNEMVDEDQKRAITTFVAEAIKASWEGVSDEVANEAVAAMLGLTSQELLALGDSSERARNYITAIRDEFLAFSKLDTARDIERLFNTIQKEIADTLALKDPELVNLPNVLETSFLGVIAGAREEFPKVFESVNTALQSAGRIGEILSSREATAQDATLAKNGIAALEEYARQVIYARSTSGIRGSQQETDAERALQEALPVGASPEVLSEFDKLIQATREAPDEMMSVLSTMNTVSATSWDRLFPELHNILNVLAYFPDRINSAIFSLSMALAEGNFNKDLITKLSETDQVLGALSRGRLENTGFFGSIDNRAQSMLAPGKVGESISVITETTKKMLESVAPEVREGLREALRTGADSANELIATASNFLLTKLEDTPSFTPDVEAQDLATQQIANVKSHIEDAQTITSAGNDLTDETIRALNTDKEIMRAIADDQAKILAAYRNEAGFIDESKLVTESDKKIVADAQKKERESLSTISSINNTLGLNDRSGRRGREPAKDILAALKDLHATAKEQLKVQYKGMYDAEGNLTDITDRTDTTAYYDAMIAETLRYISELRKVNGLSAKATPAEVMRFDAKLGKELAQAFDDLMGLQRDRVQSRIDARTRNIDAKIDTLQDQQEWMMSSNGFAKTQQNLMDKFALEMEQALAESEAFPKEQQGAMTTLFGNIAQMLRAAYGTDSSAANMTTTYQQLTMMLNREIEALTSDPDAGTKANEPLIQALERLRDFMRESANINLEENRATRELQVRMYIDEQDRQLLRSTFAFLQSRDIATTGHDPTMIATTSARDSFWNQFTPVLGSLQEQYRQSGDFSSVLSEISRMFDNSSVYLEMIAENTDNIRGAESKGTLPPSLNDILRASYDAEETLKPRADSLMAEMVSALESAGFQLDEKQRLQIYQIAYQREKELSEAQLAGMRQANEEFKQDMRSWWDMGMEAGLEGFGADSWEKFKKNVIRRVIQQLNDNLFPPIHEAITTALGRVFGKLNLQKNAEAIVNAPGQVLPAQLWSLDPFLHDNIRENEASNAVRAQATPDFTVWAQSFQQAIERTGLYNTERYTAQDAIPNYGAIWGSIPNILPQTNQPSVGDMVADETRFMENTSLMRALNDLTFSANLDPIYTFQDNMLTYFGALSEFPSEFNQELKKFKIGSVVDDIKFDDVAKGAQGSAGGGILSNVGGVLLKGLGSMISGFFMGAISYWLNGLMSGWLDEQTNQIAESQRQAQRDRVTTSGYNWSYSGSENASTPYAEYAPPITNESVKSITLHTQFYISTDAAQAMIANRRELESVVSNILQNYVRAATKTVGARV